MFRDNGVEEGYPRPVTDFGLPQGGVDAAFSRPHDRKTYFFKGGLQWSYDEALGRMDEGSPTHTVLGGQLPTPVDNMLSGSDGESPPCSRSLPRGDSAPRFLHVKGDPPCVPWRLPNLSLFPPAG